MGDRNESGNASPEAKHEPPAGPFEFDDSLLEILRCPLTLYPLVRHGDRLLCYESRKAYRIEDGIGVLLIEKAEDIPESEVPPEYRDRPVATGRPPPASG